MIPDIDFKKLYPNVTIYENMGVQDQFTMRLEVFVPTGIDITDTHRLASDASYYYHYFSGKLAGQEQKHDGTLYLVDAWKD